MAVIPSRDPLELAKRRIFQASSLAFIIAIFRLTLGISALFTYSPKTGEYMRPALLVGDGLVLFAIGYGLHRKSRVCAILFVAYVIALQLITFFVSEPAGGGLAAIIVTVTGVVLGIRAVPAAFRYHALVRER